MERIYLILSFSRVETNIKVLPFSSTKMCSADDNPGMRYESLAWRCTKYTMVNSFHLPLSHTYGWIRRDNIQSPVTTDYFHQIWFVKEIIHYCDKGPGKKVCITLRLPLYQCSNPEAHGSNPPASGYNQTLWNANRVNNSWDVLYITCHMF